MIGGYPLLLLAQVQLAYKSSKNREGMMIPGCFLALSGWQGTLRRKSALFTKRRPVLEGTKKVFRT